MSAHAPNLPPLDVQCHSCGAVAFILGEDALILAYTTGLIRRCPNCKALEIVYSKLPAALILRKRTRSEGPA